MKIVNPIMKVVQVVVILVVMSMLVLSVPTIMTLIPAFVVFGIMRMSTSGMAPLLLAGWFFLVFIAWLAILTDNDYDIVVMRYIAKMKMFRGIRDVRS